MPLSLASVISSIDSKLRDPGPTGMALGFLFLWALFTFGTWFNCRSQTDLIRNELQREAELAVHTKANEIDGLLNRTIHTIRTVSLLKGVRSAAPTNRSHEGEDVVKTGRISASDLAFVQHLFNDLSLSAGISKIYVVYDRFQPDRDQLPFLALGGSSSGLSRLNQAKPESSAAGDNASAQDPSEEYMEHLRQLMFFRRHHPTLPEQAAEHSPSVSSGLIRTSDYRHLDSGPSSDGRNESVVSIAVPIYDPSTRRFKGIVTAVLRSNILEAALVGLPFIPAGLEAGQQKQAASSVLQLRQPSNFLLENSLTGIQIFDRRNTHWASIPANRSIPAYEYQTQVEVSGQRAWMLHNYVSKATVDHKVAVTRSNALVQFALLSFALALVWATLRSMMKQQIKATKRHLALASQLGQASDDHAKTRVKLQATLDTIADLFFEVGADGRYHDIYSRCADLLAMPADNYLGNTIAETLPQDVAKLWMEALKEASEHGVSTGKQYQLHLPQGDRWFELSVSRKTTLPSEEPRFIVLAHDITPRKLAEEGLRKREAFFRLISENVGDHIVVVDLIGRCVYASPAYERFVRSSADLRGTDAFAAVHPEDQESVRQAFAASVKSGDSCEVEYRHVATGGHTYPIECHMATIRNSRDQIENVVLVSRDISERKAKDSEIENLAFYDSLTELPNRRLLLDRLRQALARLARTGSNGALMFLDLDNFKALNDTLGHAVGDILLQQVAARLLLCVRENDTVARLGGDEFVVMLEDLDQEQDEAAGKAELIAEKVLAALNKPYRLGDYEHTSTPSIGVTLFGKQTEDIDELLKRADLAMYQAKTAGRNAIRFFDAEMRQRVLTQIALEADIRDGLGKGQFVLYYQAQIGVDGSICGAESLMRWQHPERGLISPLEFIPLAEESGLILPLGQSIMELACRQLAAWAAHPRMASLSLAVNVSARQFHSANFVEQVVTTLQQTGANPNLLKLELTESLFVSNVDEIIVKMTTLKAIGVRFSLDDFGTGYSSLSYLKRLPLDQLKIDQSFVRDLLTDANDVAIARTIVGLAESLGLSVIAEGVETEGQRLCLAQQGCFAYQGFLVSKPVPIEAFERLVLANA